MGRQYYGEWKSFNSVTWRAELHRDAGALNHLLKIAVDPIITRQGQNDDLFTNPIRASRAEVVFIARDENDFGNLVNIGQSEEQEWVMKIYKDSVLYWVGMVLADQIDWDREARETGFGRIKITAVDGLERLAGFDVLPGWFTSGRETFAFITVQIIAMLGLSDEWASNTDFIRWAGQHENANTNASYGTFDAKIRDLSLIKNKDIFKDLGEVEWMNCKEALEQILTAFGARIHHSDGVYWIVQGTAYNDSDWTYDAYDNAGVIVGSYGQTYTHRKTITLNNNLRPEWERYPTLSYQHPFRATVAEFDRVNGVIATKTTQNTTAITCTHNDIIATASPPGRAVKIEINVDFSYYASPVTKYEVHKTYYADNGAGGTKYQPIGGVWTAIAGSPVADVQTYYDTGGGIMTKNFRHSVELVAPPSGQTNVVCSVEVKKVRGVLVGRPTPTSYPVSWATATTAAHEFTGTVTIMQSFSTSMPWQYIQENEFESNQDAPRDTNSTEKTIECAYYNGKKYDIGSVLVKTGASTWGEAGNWSAPWTALTGDLPEMLANQIAGAYADFREMINGTFHDDGTYGPVDSLYFDNTIWIFNGGTHNLKSDVWDGEWIAVTVVYTNINNNGEGERVLKEEELVWDGIGDVNRDLDEVRKQVGQMPLVTLPIEIINNGVDAPTTDPGEDAKYLLSLLYTYDSTEPTLEWKTELMQIEALYQFISVNSSPYTANRVGGEWIFECDTSGGAITFNIPTAVGNKAKYHIMKTTGDASAVTITANGAETISGSATVPITTQWQVYTIVSNGTNWRII